MFFWAVVSDEINRVIEFFPTRWQAERMLAKGLWDEPAWQKILRVQKIEFRTGRRTSLTKAGRPCGTLVARAREAEAYGSSAQVLWYRAAAKRPPLPAARPTATMLPSG